LKNWILILALLSLHGCKVFNQGIHINKDSNLTVSSDQLGIADASDESENSNKGVYHLHAIAGEEEHELFLLPDHSEIRSALNSFTSDETSLSYYLRDLPDKFAVPIYIFSKRLIL
jgi:hypothetical protein